MIVFPLRTSGLSSQQRNPPSMQVWLEYRKMYFLSDTKRSDYVQRCELQHVMTVSGWKRQFRSRSYIQRQRFLN